MWLHTCMYVRTYVWHCECVCMYNNGPIGSIIIIYVHMHATTAVCTYVSVLVWVPVREVVSLWHCVKLLSVYLPTFSLSSRWYWDILVVILLMFTVIVLPVSIAFYSEDQTKPLWLTLNALVDFLFFMDIIINFRTGIASTDNPDIVSHAWPKSKSPCVCNCMFTSVVVLGAFKV